MIVKKGDWRFQADFASKLELRASSRADLIARSISEEPSSLTSSSVKTLNPSWIGMVRSIRKSKE